MTSISGLTDREAREVSDAFGVSLEQVRRDHLISLVLAAIQPMSSGLVFFGGTALARTYLPDGRLSEDIDLISTGDRSETAPQLTRSVDRALRATYGRLRWSRPLASVREVEPVIV